MLEELKDFVEIKEGQEEALAEYLSKKLLTPESVKAYLDSHDGKKLIQPILDRYHAKGLETWKSNNLETLIEEEVARRHPAETEDQKRIRKLEQKLAESEKAWIQERLAKEAQSIATQKGLPVELVDHFVGTDEETTLVNLEKLERVWNESVQNTVKTRFRDAGRDVQRTREEPTQSLEVLKDKYKNAVANGIKLHDRVALSRQIQELEQS